MSWATGWVFGSMVLVLMVCTLRERASQVLCRVKLRRDVRTRE